MKSVSTSKSGFDFSIDGQTVQKIIGQISKWKTFFYDLQQIKKNVNIFAPWIISYSLTNTIVTEDDKIYI